MPKHPSSTGITSTLSIPSQTGLETSSGEAMDSCCDRPFEHVHAPRKEDFEKGKVTSNKGVPHVTETEEEDDEQVEE